MNLEAWKNILDKKAQAAPQDRINLDKMNNIFVKYQTDQKVLYTKLVAQLNTLQENVPLTTTQPVRDQMVQLKKDTAKLMAAETSLSENDWLLIL